MMSANSRIRFALQIALRWGFLRPVSELRKRIGITYERGFKDVITTLTRNYVFRTTRNYDFNS